MFEWYTDWRKRRLAKKVRQLFYEDVKYFLHEHEEHERGRVGIRKVDSSDDLSGYAELHKAAKASDLDILNGDIRWQIQKLYNLVNKYRDLVSNLDTNRRD